MFRHFLRQALLCAWLASAAFAADALPRVSGETLSGNAVILPDAAKGKAAVLIISFSRAAQEQTRLWGEKLKKELPNTATYQVLELEDVPRLFRGFVKSSIRKSIPKESHDRFILLFEGQDALKKVANYQAADEAYVLLLDANGNVVWREHGAVDEKKVAGLRQQLEKK
jgi:predicted transcriptional regulator